MAWKSGLSAANNMWYDVCYGNGLFVAVASSGTGKRVMTSPDGIHWTAQASAANNSWRGLCYGNGLFVAVAISGTGNRVMTSPDGITWTARTSAADNEWVSACYANGLFVVVGGTAGTGNHVMTSPDGMNWTLHVAAAENYWRSVCYGNGIFVAVASSGTGNRVMTSPDGITWTAQASAANNDWKSVCYGNGLFVAVASSGTGDRVMTSSDGSHWTACLSATDNNWQSVCYGNGLFVAVASSGDGDLAMYDDLTNPGIFSKQDGHEIIIGEATASELGEIPILAGQFIVVRDTAELCFDTTKNTRIFLGSPGDGSSSGQALVTWANITNKPNNLAYFDPLGIGDKVISDDGGYVSVAVLDSQGKVSPSVLPDGIGGDSITLASTTPANLAASAAVGNGVTAARDNHVHAFPGQLATSRTFAISGGATGTATSFNGSANITIPVTALDASKLTGAIPSSVTAVTQTAGTNNTSVATTAFVQTAVTAATPSLTNYVTTDTAQTVSGQKTFGKQIIVTGSGKGGYTWLGDRTLAFGGTTTPSFELFGDAATGVYGSMTTASTSGKAGKLVVTDPLGIGDKVIADDGSLKPVISVIKAQDDLTAISQSGANPNNIYYIHGTTQGPQLTMIQAPDDATALSLSASNPNNIYFTV